MAKKDAVKEKLDDIQREEITALDNARIEEIVRGYRILFLSEKHFLRKFLKSDSIRIYDKSFISVSRYGDRLFTSTKNNLLTDKENIYLTYKEQFNILESRGVWGSSQEQRMVDLRDKVSDLIKEKDEVFSYMSAGDDTVDIQKLGERAESLAKQINDTHAELIELINTQYVFFSDSVEIQASQMQKLGYVVSAVTENSGDDVYDNSKCLFKTVPDMENKLRSLEITELMTECYRYWNLSSVDSESFFAESPEELILGSSGELQPK